MSQVPQNYRCFKCKIKGHHFIQHCPNACGNCGTKYSYKSHKKSCKNIQEQFAQDERDKQKANISNENESFTWQLDEPIQISFNFTASSETPFTDFNIDDKPSIDAHSFKNDFNTVSNNDKLINDIHWSFNLVQAYINEIVADQTRIVPMDLVGICYAFFIDKQFVILIDFMTDVTTMQEYFNKMYFDEINMPFSDVNEMVVKPYYNILNDIHTHSKFMIKPEALCEKYIFALEEYSQHFPRLPGFSHPWADAVRVWVMLEMDLIHTLLGISKLVNEFDLIRYGLLRCNISSLPHICDEFKTIENYVKLNHDVDFHKYSLTVEKVFKFNDFLSSSAKCMTNKKLLWYGNKITNYCDILLNGLSVPICEAPIAPYIFGKGIYFSDMCSDAANKCCVSEKSQMTGLVLLCEVSLGGITELHRANYDAKHLLDETIMSIKGCGEIIPDPSTHIKLKNDCVVPCGKPIASGVTWNSLRGEPTLRYNQYVAYDPSQVEMKYLVQLKFDYHAWEW